MPHATPFPALARVALLLAVAFAAIAPARNALAQESPKVTVAVSRDHVDLGDSLTYQVTIDGASAAQERALPASDAYKADYLGGRDESSHSYFSINGRASESTVSRYVMQWRITPLTEGRAEIPSYTLKVGDKTLTVPSIAFTASQPGTNPNFILKLEPDKTEAYVGEPVHMKLTWGLGGKVRSASFSGPDGGKEYDVGAIDPRPVKARSNPIQQNDPYRIVPFLDGQAVVTSSQATIDEREMATFTMDLVITPRHAGALEIGPFRVAFDEVVGRRQPSFFDSPFDDLASTRRSVIASNAVTLNVKPLPEEGRPPDFNGLIGKYSLDAAAGNTEASVGDPITLTLTIHGPEPLDALKPPSLESQPQLTADFKPAPEGWDAPASDTQAFGQRTFTTTIRPKSDSVTQVPPIRLPYFDTSAGKYDVATSQAIPLKVHASKEVTLADALRPGATSAVALPSGEPARLTSAPAGVGANTETLDALVDQRVNLLATIRSPAGAAFIALPPLAVAFLGALAYRRRTQDPAAIARRDAISSARRALRSAASAAEIAAALRTALAPFLGMAPDAVTSRDAAAAPLPPSAQDHAAAALSALESAAFDKADIDLGAAKRHASDTLDELSRA